MMPMGCFYSSHMPYGCPSRYSGFGFGGYPSFGMSYMPLPPHRPWECGLDSFAGNLIGNLAGECFANIWAPVSTALSDVSYAKGVEAAERIYKYFGLA